MACSRGIVCAVVVVLLGSAGAGATPYWVAWEGEGATAALPEQCGWSRNWGNWQGAQQGGANRTLENGILTYDSLYDSGVYDFSYMDRPIDPGPGEIFALEWRVFVEQDNSYLGDAGLAVASDTAMCLGFEVRPAEIDSVFEPGVVLPIAPGVFHDYRLTSWDMRAYALYIDGELARVGSFKHLVGASEVAWGDGTQDFTGGSLHHWDYFRFGAVVPEPAPLVLLAAALACFVGRRG